ncbi:ABC transporter substrate-binding protein [Algoriphagus pacificus]|uniref:ABC transporter substrate-binding protein n=1 Tax=Algoriphagus pacificus TaxID=2811234 RepID=A0ABS3CDF6_9BACT|nr:helical backbone metal receptor [Algoriphagus pacificus]MBN7815128.1 ABC transporter substrate-binding protein [Algoriphagus pacificus]
MIYTDQLNRNIVLPSSPQRIVSLVPSQTELLVDLGLVDRIVGITKFCVHPKHLLKTKTIVGGTKNYRFEVIQGLKPDLIIANKEENEREGIEKLAKEYPVWISDITTLQDSFEMILGLGKMLDANEKASEIVFLLKSDFKESFEKKGTAVYLIWNNPIMVAGKDTFINEMLSLAGFENKVTKSRYPTLTMEELKELNPNYLLLSSEPFPFKEKHLADFKKQFPEATVKLVDGEYFSWYGSRLLGASAYLKRI